MTERQQTLARVRLWGEEVGSVTWDRKGALGHFSYTEQFQDTGLPVAPVTMPLAANRFAFPDLNSNVFKGLPGFLADSLPDKFGNAVIDTWLEQNEMAAGELNPVEQLCLIGDKGMGALEFEPQLSSVPDQIQPLDLPALVELINLILGDEPADGALHELREAMQSLMRIGISADGSRAKAIIALDEEARHPIEGHTSLPPHYSHWLLKFDGITGNRDREAADPQGWGRIEYAYYLMARASGINMMECRLLAENGRRHFITRRFDRTPAGEKIHRQSLCAIGHMDFDALGAYSYEDVVDIMRGLDLPQEDIEEQFRRMVFNVVARNHDDHAKNIAFLMDRQGRWSLAPAYDLTFAYNPQGEWTRRHQMSLNGKRDNFSYDDLSAVGARFSIPADQTNTIIEQVKEAVSQWPDHAERAGVDPVMIASIGRDLRVDTL